MSPRSQTADRCQPWTSFAAFWVVRLTIGLPVTASVSSWTSARRSTPTTTAREPFAARAGDAWRPAAPAAAGGANPAAIPSRATVRTVPSASIDDELRRADPAARREQRQEAVPHADDAECEPRQRFAVQDTARRGIDDDHLGRLAADENDEPVGRGPDPLEGGGAPEPHQPGRSQAVQAHESEPPVLAAADRGERTVGRGGEDVGGRAADVQDRGTHRTHRRRRDPAKLAAAGLPFDGQHSLRLRDACRRRAGEDGDEEQSDEQSLHARCTPEPRPGVPARLTEVWTSSTFLSPARGRWAPGSPRSSPGRDGACRSTTLRPARPSAGSQRCGRASRSSRRRAAPIPTRCWRG